MSGWDMAPGGRPPERPAEPPLPETPLRATGDGDEPIEVEEDRTSTYLGVGALVLVGGLLAWNATRR